MAPATASQVTNRTPEIRHNWTFDEIAALFALPFNDLLFEAQSLHRRYFDPNQVQVSTLLSIKTGACPEDCAYCPQSTRYDTGLDVEKLMEVEKVVEQARAAKASGATRFCMGAAWRSPKQRDMPYVVAMVKGVRELGMTYSQFANGLKKAAIEIDRKVLADMAVHDRAGFAVIVDQVKAKLAA